MTATGRKRMGVPATGLLCAFVCFSGVLSPAGVAGGDPGKSLLFARNHQEARENLEKGLSGSAGRLLLISPHDYLSGLLLPLHRSGALKELTVVLPFDNDISAGHLEDIRAFLEKGGVSEADRKSLALRKGSVTGSIEGMPITISTLPGLPKQDMNFLVALDTAFLSAIYRNEVKTPMVDLAWKLLLTLRDRRVDAANVLIFDAVGRPDFPLEHGYLPDLLRDMLSAPEQFAATLPERWRLLKAAEMAYFFAQYADGMRLFKEYLGRAPGGDASACYKIAMMAIRDLDVELSLQWLNKAAEADPRYQRGYAEAAGYLYRKEMLEESERFLLAGLTKFPKAPLMASALAGLYLKRGEAMREAGELNQAAEFFRMASGVEGADPKVREWAETMEKAIVQTLPQ